MADGDGLISLAGLARTKQNGIEKMVNLVRNDISRSRPIHIVVMHADAPEEANNLKERIAGEFNCVELFITDFSPVMTYATGRGTLALAFYESF